MTLSSDIHRDSFVAYRKGIPKRMFDLKRFCPLEHTSSFSLVSYLVLLSPSNSITGQEFREESSWELLSFALKSWRDACQEEVYPRRTKTKVYTTMRLAFSCREAPGLWSVSRYQYQPEGNRL